MLLELLLGLGAGAIGLGGHLSAKETNEYAEEIVGRAKTLYNQSKDSLEKAQKETETALLNLGCAKKDILNGSIAQFLQAYDRIKDVQINESIGIEEIDKFMIGKQEALQLQEMSNIYRTAFSSGVTGAATGAALALAASGSLPIVTGVISTAGTALLAGEVGVATGLAGSALSFGAAMTPLPALVAPVVLFTGISSSMKADENLEKARTMYAEATAAAEKMETAKTICEAINKKAYMYETLLRELDEMFAVCTVLLDEVTRKKTRRYKDKARVAKKLTQDEIRLVAVTRALAGAVKAVIDTPLLDASGQVSTAAQNVYEQTANALPEFKETVIKVSNSGGHKSNRTKKRLIFAIAALLLIVVGIALISHFSQNSSEIDSEENSGYLTESFMQQSPVVEAPATESVDVVASTQIPNLNETTSMEEVVDGATTNDVDVIDISTLVGESRIRGLAYFTVFEDAGTYYFNFAISSGSRVNYLASPVPLIAEGQCAVASYVDDNQGNSGTVRITQDDSGKRYITAEIDNKELPQYDSYDNLNALIFDKAEMYYSEEIRDYPIYKDYLEP